MAGLQVQPIPIGRECLGGAFVDLRRLIGGNVTVAGRVHRGKADNLATPLGHETVNAGVGEPELPAGRAFLASWPVR